MHEKKKTPGMHHVIFIWVIMRYKIQSSTSEHGKIALLIRLEIQFECLCNLKFCFYSATDSV